MFQKRITPFTCIFITILACIITFVAVSSFRSVEEKSDINENRLDSAEYGQYKEFIELVGKDSEKHAKIAQMIAMIEGSYIHDYDTEILWESIYKALVISIGDAYSQYLTAQEYEALVDSGDGDFVGIGVHASYDIDSKGIYIFGVIPDSPAEKAGLKNGDIVINAEGIEANGENYYEMLDAVRGEAGTDVKLTILRDGERIDFSVTRNAVASENVLYEKLDNNIAYIRILSFADTAVSEEFTKKIALAQSESCDKFIFDVRNNSGGYLEEINGVLDLLLPEGPIINIVDANENVKTYNSDANCIEGKMVVLCNENTASAAELFTAALRDYELADIVGTTTFGKGTLQTTRLMPDGSALKLSTAFYNPPSNVSYDKIGITPDYELELDEEWLDRFFKMPKDKDTQLQKAIELLASTK
ncbi:MAG: S41 family peptidase [Clostridia bacterium]|nr:S41 family peptidase [Clostridia bacterium]